MWIWATMSIFLLSFATFSYIVIDSGAGTRMLVLALLCVVMFILRYRLSKQHRA